MVEIAGKPSGIAATANEIATNNISNGKRPRKIPTKKVTAAIPKINIVKVLPNFSWSRCNGVNCFSVPDNMVAICPTSVCIPVPVTTPTPRP